MWFFCCFFFFFSSRRRHTRSLRDWSSDVCSSDLEARAIHARKWPACEEGGDRLAPPIPGWQWWHRHPCVVGQHGGDRLDVAALPGSDIAVHDVTQRRAAEETKRRLLALLGEPLVDRPARAARRCPQ